MRAITCASDSFLFPSKFADCLCLELWNPIWRYFMGGCEMNRSLGDVIRNAGPWESPDTEIWAQKGLPEEWSIMPRVEGRLIKSAEM